MKFSVERDVLTDAVAWAARSLPVRPSVPVLAGLLIETNDGGDGLVLSTFDYETSARATVPASVQDEGKALVSGRLLADICRSLPDKPVDMAIEGAKVVPAPAARRSSRSRRCRSTSTRRLPAMPEATGSVSSDVFAQAVAPGGHRGRPRRHAPGAHRCADRDRGREHLAAGHRPVPALAARARLEPRHHRRRGQRPGAGPGAGRHRQVADVGLRGDRSRCPAPASGEGIIGFEGEVGGGSRRTTTRLLDGEFPRVRTLFPTEHKTVARVDRTELVEAVKRVSLVAERNTAVQLMFDDNGLTLDAGHGDEALATERIEAQVKGDAITTGLQPAVPARRAHRDRAAGRGAGVHPAREARGDHRGAATSTARRTPTSSTCSCRAACSADRGCRHRRWHPAASTSTDRVGGRIGHRARRARQDGRQHARAAPPRRPHGRRLRPQPRGPRRRLARGDGRGAPLSPRWSG